MLDTVIRNGTVVTIDRDRRVLTPGAVAIRKGEIVDVVAGDPPTAWEATHTIDAAGKIVMPGLIDTHGHAGHCLTRGLGLGVPGEGWERIVEELYFRASDLEFWEAESRIAAYERLSFGVTTSMSMTGSSPRIDSSAYGIAAATGYDELGLRHIVAVGPPNGPWPRHYVDRATGEEIVADLDHALRTTEELIQAFQGRGNPRLSFFIGPSAVAPTADASDSLAVAQVKGVVDLADRYNARIHAHAYQGQIAAAEAIDPTILGDRTLLAHCAGISLHEVDILAKTGTHATSGPLTYAYALARFPVIEALDAGVNVVWSTDGTSPDRSFDVLDQARIGVQLQRAYFHDPDLLPVGKTLEMITIDAARAIGMADQIGSLEVGKRADIILLDARQAHLAPVMLAPMRLVGHANGKDVCTVLVDGEVLMEDRQISADLDGIIDAGKDAVLTAWARTGFGDINAMHPDTWQSVRYGSTAGSE